MKRFFSTKSFPVKDVENSRGYSKHQKTNLVTVSNWKRYITFIFEVSEIIMKAVLFFIYWWMLVEFVLEAWSLTISEHFYPWSWILLDIFNTISHSFYFLWRPIIFRGLPKVKWPPSPPGNPNQNFDSLSYLNVQKVSVFDHNNYVDQNILFDQNNCRQVHSIKIIIIWFIKQFKRNKNWIYVF